MSQPKRSKLVRGLRISLLISVIASVLLLCQTIDLKQLVQLQKINFFYIGLSLAIVALMWISQGLSMQILAEALGEKLHLGDATKNFLVGSFISNVTPFASGGGPFQVLLLHQKGMTLGKASSIITVQWTLRQIFFGILGPVFFLFFQGYIDSGKIPAKLFNAAVLTGIVLTLVLLFFVWRPQVIPALANGVVRLPGLRGLMRKEGRQEWFDRLIERVYHEIGEFHACLWRLIRTKKLELLLATVFISLFWIFYFMIAPVLLIGLGAKPYFVQAFIMQTIMFLILPYAPTPGASGVAELGFAAFFAPFVPIHLLGIVAVTWRLLTYYFSTIFGGMITLRILAAREGA